MESWRKIRVKRYIKAFPKDAQAIADVVHGDKIKSLEDYIRELEEKIQSKKKPKRKKDDNG